MTAETSSADTYSTENLCLITYTDLTKFDSGLENRCKILYQLAEIDSSVGGKIKQYFIIVKSILRIDQFHFQIMFTYLLLADFKRVFFFQTILFFSFFVCFCRNSEDFFQRMYYFLFSYFLRSENNSSEFDSTRGLNDYMIADLHFIVFRVKIINLAHVSKSDTNNFCHSISP